MDSVCGNFWCFSTVKCYRLSWFFFLQISNSVQCHFRRKFYANQRIFSHCLKFYHLQCICSVLKISSSVQCAPIFGENYTPFSVYSGTVKHLSPILHFQNFLTVYHTIQYSCTVCSMCRAIFGGNSTLIRNFHALLKGLDKVSDSVLSHCYHQVMSVCTVCTVYHLFSIVRLNKFYQHLLFKNYCFLSAWMK